MGGTKLNTKCARPDLFISSLTNDVNDVFDGDAGFGDVGRNNDFGFARRRRIKDLSLKTRRHQRMQRNDVKGIGPQKLGRFQGRLALAA